MPKTLVVVVDDDPAMEAMFWEGLGQREGGELPLGEGTLLDAGPFEAHI